MHVFRKNQQPRNTLVPLFPGSAAQAQNDISNLKELRAALPKQSEK